MGGNTNIGWERDQAKTLERPSGFLQDGKQDGSRKEFWSVKPNTKTLQGDNRVLASENREYPKPGPLGERVTKRIKNRPS